MQADTIDEVIQELDNIIQHSETNNSQAGYFPALYRKVTVAVKEAIEQGEFEDGPRMERFDVIFANHYLLAYQQDQNKQAITKSWAVAFSAIPLWRPLVLQHLLLGMNAHINLDLGIAAARTSPGNQLPSLKNDFDKINEILADLTGQVETDLAEIWPPLAWVTRIFGRLDEKIIGFSMETARQFAWNFAVRLAPLDVQAQQEEIKLTDCIVEKLGCTIKKPGARISILLFLIRICERGTIAQKIGYLKQ